MARLLSVNVGLPRDIASRSRTVHTAAWKASIYVVDDSQIDRRRLLRFQD